MRSLVPLTFVLLSVAMPAQERLFRPGDEGVRREVAAELEQALRQHEDLATTTALAAAIGSRLPDGSHARAWLRSAVSDALAGDGEAVRERLRSELYELVATLAFEPRVEAPNPQGFPAFGRAVGEIELVHYPAYRMVATGMRGGSNRAFWPLFRHIEENGIAMTTPVQMDYADGEAVERPVRMAFLYGDPNIEPEHVDRGVEVVAIEAHDVLRIGAVGAESKARIEAMRQRLLDWLAEPANGHEAAGPMRLMGYNSPSVSRDRRYFEVQIPVRSVAEQKVAGQKGEAPKQAD